MLFCNKCGNMVDDEANFCQRCGNVILGKFKRKSMDIRILCGYIVLSTIYPLIAFVLLISQKLFILIDNEFLSYYGENLLSVSIIELPKLDKIEDKYYPESFYNNLTAVKNISLVFCVLLGFTIVLTIIFNLFMLIEAINYGNRIRSYFIPLLLFLVVPFVTLYISKKYEFGITSLPIIILIFSAVSEIICGILCQNINKNRKIKG